MAKFVKAIALIDLKDKKPAPGEVWTNYTADFHGVMDMPFTKVEIMKDHRHVWISSPAHRGVKRAMLDIAIITIEDEKA